MIGIKIEERNCGIRTTPNNKELEEILAYCQKNDCQVNLRWKDVISCEHKNLPRKKKTLIIRPDMSLVEIERALVTLSPCQKSGIDDLSDRLYDGYRY